MARRQTTRTRGFTLVELLTVISIIALLISILLPSLAKARSQAKRVKVQTQIDAIGKGLEMFRNDFRDQYPRSAKGEDRITGLPNTSNSNTVLSGAHWLARALVGADMQGMDVNGEALKSVSSTDLEIPYADYTPAKKLFERRGTYVELEAAPAVRDDDVSKAPNPGAGPRTGRLILTDGYGFPILYYRPSVGATLPFATLGGSAVYNQGDNEDFTGSDVTGVAGWQLKIGKVYDESGGTKYLHAITRFGYKASSPNTIDAGASFARFFHNQDVLNTSGLVKPYNEERFILLSAGEDGVYGTADDVKNFRIAQ